MKTVKLEVDPETAKRFLAGFEKQISETIRARDAMSLEIKRLEQSATSLREQIIGANGSSGRQPSGQNKARIIEYLKNIPDNKGARMSEIRKATGIGASSAAFTLKNNTDTFVRRKKVWKLK